MTPDAGSLALAGHSNGDDHGQADSLTVWVERDLGVSWQLYIGRATVGEVSKAQPPEGLSAMERKQFARAKRTAGAIIKSGEAGPKSGTFDVSLAGHSGDGQANSITVSVAQDLVT